MIEIQDVHKSFGALQVLRGVSMTVSKGEVVSVIGGSGSGKSTLLMCINGLESIQAGRIGQQRAHNNGETDATTGDVLKAAPFAAASTFLEKLGIGGVAGKFGSSPKMRTRAAPSTSWRPSVPCA